MFSKLLQVNSQFMSFSFSRASHVEEATYCQHSRCTTPTWAKHPTRTIMWSKVILFFFKRNFFASTSPHELFSCLIFLRFYHGKQENDVFIPGRNELTNNDQLFELMASFEVYCILGYHFCFPLILLCSWNINRLQRGDMMHTLQIPTCRVMICWVLCRSSVILPR